MASNIFDECNVDSDIRNGHKKTLAMYNTCSVDMIFSKCICRGQVKKEP